MAKLDPRESRQFTDRECSKLIGGLIGTLAQMASLDDVRSAIRWWAQTDEAWEMVARQTEAYLRAVRGEVQVQKAEAQA